MLAILVRGSAGVFQVQVEAPGAGPAGFLVCRQAHLPDKARTPTESRKLPLHFLCMDDEGNSKKFSD